MHRFQVREIRSLAFVWTTWYFIQTLNCPSIICPDDKNFPSRPSSVSRTFELFQLASVWTSQQHVQTLSSVRQVERFLSKTQICENSCNRPDDVCSRPNAILDKASRAYKVQPSRRQPSSISFLNDFHNLNLQLILNLKSHIIFILLNIIIIFNILKNTQIIHNKLKSTYKWFRL
jgi:hypothetical protein